MMRPPSALRVASGLVAALALGSICVASQALDSAVIYWYYGGAYPLDNLLPLHLAVVNESGRELWAVGSFVSDPERCAGAGGKRPSWPSPDCGPDYIQPHVMKTHDGGLTWTDPVTVPPLARSDATAMVIRRFTADGEADQVPFPLDTVNRQPTCTAVCVAGGQVVGSVEGAREVWCSSDSVSWQKVADLPAPRNAAAFVPIPSQDMFILLGGYNPLSNGTADDVVTSHLWIAGFTDSWSCMPAYWTSRPASMPVWRRPYPLAVWLEGPNVLVVGGGGDVRQFAEPSFTPVPWSIRPSPSPNRSPTRSPVVNPPPLPEEHSRMLFLTPPAPMPRLELGNAGVWMDVRLSKPLDQAPGSYSMFPANDILPSQQAGVIKPQVSRSASKSPRPPSPPAAPSNGSPVPVAGDDEMPSAPIWPPADPVTEGSNSTGAAEEGTASAATEPDSGIDGDSSSSSDGSGGGGGGSGEATPSMAPQLLRLRLQRRAQASAGGDVSSGSRSGSSSPSPGAGFDVTLEGKFSAPPKSPSPSASASASASASGSSSTAGDTQGEGRHWSVSVTGTRTYNPRGDGRSPPPTRSPAAKPSSAFAVGDDPDGISGGSGGGGVTNGGGDMLEEGVDDGGVINGGGDMLEDGVDDGGPDIAAKEEGDPKKKEHYLAMLLGPSMLLTPRRPYADTTTWHTRRRRRRQRRRQLGADDGSSDSGGDSSTMGSGYARHLEDTGSLQLEAVPPGTHFVYSPPFWAATWEAAMGGGGQAGHYSRAPGDASAQLVQRDPVFPHVLTVEAETGMIWRGTAQPCFQPSTCGPGRFATQCVTSPADSECRNCSTCPPGHFASAPCRSYANRVCTPCTTCTGSFVQTAPCTATKDAICTSITDIDEGEQGGPQGTNPPDVGEGSDTATPSPQPCGGGTGRPCVDTGNGGSSIPTWASYAFLGLLGAAAAGTLILPCLSPSSSSPSSKRRRQQQLAAKGGAKSSSAATAAGDDDDDFSSEGDAAQSQQASAAGAMSLWACVHTASVVTSSCGHALLAAFWLGARGTAPFGAALTSVMVLGWTAHAALMVREMRRIAGARLEAGYAQHSGGGGLGGNNNVLCLLVPSSWQLRHHASAEGDARPPWRPTATCLLGGCVFAMASWHPALLLSLHPGSGSGSDTTTSAAAAAVEEEDGSRSTKGEVGRLRRLASHLAGTTGTLLDCTLFLTVFFTVCLRPPPPVAGQAYNASWLIIPLACLLLDGAAIAQGVSLLRRQRKQQVQLLQMSRGRVNSGIKSGGSVGGNGAEAKQPRQQLVKVVAFGQQAKKNGAKPQQARFGSSVSGGGGRSGAAAASVGDEAGDDDGQAIVSSSSSNAIGSNSSTSAAAVTTTTSPLTVVAQFRQPAQRFAPPEGERPAEAIVRNPLSHRAMVVQRQQQQQQQQQQHGPLGLTVDVTAAGGSTGSEAYVPTPTHSNSSQVSATSTSAGTSTGSSSVRARNPRAAAALAQQQQQQQHRQDSPSLGPATRHQTGGAALGAASAAATASAVAAAVSADSSATADGSSGAAPLTHWLETAASAAASTSDSGGTRSASSAGAAASQSLEGALAAMAAAAGSPEGRRLAAQTDFFRRTPWLLPAASEAAREPVLPEEWRRILSVLEEVARQDTDEEEDGSPQAAGAFCSGDEPSSLIDNNNNNNAAASSHAVSAAATAAME